jgi:hypothetical protein
MKRLTRNDLYGLEEYADIRAEFRARVIEHKRHRQVAVGPNATLYFEDRLTMQYQIQEMLRVERIFETEGIEAELDAYNPLIPDGRNLKATLMLEYADVQERRRRLAELRGVEEQVYVQVEGFGKVYSVANEDLGRTNQEKTSAVHFLRFELTAQARSALRGGSALAVGIDHREYTHRVEAVPEAVRAALATDLNG